MDKRSATRVLSTCGTLCNHSDRVYRNIWCGLCKGASFPHTKDTCWNPYRIWRETSEPGLLYGLGKTWSQFFFMTSWVGDTPYPLSDVIWRHVACLDSYCIKVPLALRWFASRFELLRSCCCRGVPFCWRRVKVSWSLVMLHAVREGCSWDTVILCFRCISCGWDVWRDYIRMWNFGCVWRKRMKRVKFIWI